MSMKKKLITTIYTVIILIEILGIGFLAWKWIEPTNFGYAILFVCVWIVVACIITILTCEFLNEVLDEEDVVKQPEDVEEPEWRREISEEKIQAMEAKYKVEHQQATIELYHETMKNLFSFINNLERFRWRVPSPYENSFLSEQDAWEVARNRPPFHGYLHSNYYSDNAFLDDLDITPIKELKEFIDTHRELAQSLIEWGIKYGITTQDTCDRMDARNYITSCIMGPEYWPPIRDIKR